MKGGVETLNGRQAEMHWHRNLKGFLLNIDAKISLSVPILES